MNITKQTPEKCTDKDMVKLITTVQPWWVYRQQKRKTEDLASLWSSFWSGYAKIRATISSSGTYSTCSILVLVWYLFPSERYHQYKLNVVMKPHGVWHHDHTGQVRHSAAMQPLHSIPPHPTQVSSDREKLFLMDPSV